MAQCMNWRIALRGLRYVDCGDNAMHEFDIPRRRRNPRDAMHKFVDCGNPVDCGAAVHAVLLHCGAAVDRRSRHFYGAIRALLCDPFYYQQF